MKMTEFPGRRGTTCVFLASVLALTACAAVGPTYEQPTAKLADTWMAPVPHGGEQVALKDWWAQFEDETLLKLIEAAEADSPNLERAVANIDSARASIRSAGSSKWPTLDGKLSRTRTRQTGGMGGGVYTGMMEGGGNSPTSTYGVRSAGLEVSWELDLFGKIRRNAEGAEARLVARVNDWHEARISLAAEVADTYVQYRGCQLLGEVHREQVMSMERTNVATRQLVDAGLTPPADASRTKASLAGALSQQEAQLASCRLLLTSLHSLTGVEEETLSIWLNGDSMTLPKPRAFRVDKVPADALRQRPDVAARERELAASSAAMGAAKADLYPSLSLSGEITSAVYSLLSSSVRTWSFGPTLTIPVFDGSRRRAALKSAEASYRVAHAEWRRGVKGAVKEIEEALINLDGADRRSGKATEAAAMHKAYYESMQMQWQEGGSSLLELEEARRSALEAEVERVTLLRDQVQYWIALYKAVGGGWLSETRENQTEPDQADSSAS